jgi:hypothetical protein
VSETGVAAATARDPAATALAAAVIARKRRRDESGLLSEVALGNAALERFHLLLVIGPELGDASDLGHHAFNGLGRRNLNFLLNASKRLLEGLVALSR